MAKMLMNKPSKATSKRNKVNRLPPRTKAREAYSTKHDTAFLNYYVERNIEDALSMKEEIKLSKKEENERLDRIHNNLLSVKEDIESYTELYNKAIKHSDTGKSGAYLMKINELKSKSDYLRKKIRDGLLKINDLDMQLDEVNKLLKKYRRQKTNFTERISRAEERNSRGLNLRNFKEGNYKHIER